jgi:acyl carrier protein
VTLREQLLELIRSWNLELDGPLSDDTALITSGLFDSQALFNLMLWIEQQTGRSIDPASLDFVAEWNSVRDVVGFIERARRT